MPKELVSPSWAPDLGRVESTRLIAYSTWLEGRTGQTFGSYSDLWEWSVGDVAQFWDSIWTYFDVIGSRGTSPALAQSSMPGADWFPGAMINYAENALRHRLDSPAIVTFSEGRGPISIGWDELRGRVGALAEWLTEMNVQPGDRVVGYLPAVSESAIAFLACASIGAVWASCSQEFSPQGAAERFGQLEPVVLIAADGYRHGGKEFDREQNSVELLSQLTSVREFVWVDHLRGATARPAGSHSFAELVSAPIEPAFRPLPFDHPLWVLFTSATSGPPKGIVHGHGGIVLEHLKFGGLHLDLRPGTRFLWYTTTSWVMWNLQVSGLLAGATIHFLEGSPTWPSERALWDVIAEHQIEVFGTGAGYLVASQNAGLKLSDECDLSFLRTIGCTGSPLPPSCAAWVQDSLPDVWLANLSGGTDVAAGFCGPVPTLPVYGAEIQARLLGVAMYAWVREGVPAIDEVGELVVTKPMPSMPVQFWNDPDGSRLKAAYFETYPGVWRHGDWVTVTDRGGVIVHGRSDATLNRNGVRMGSAEIYEVLDRQPGLIDSLVVGVEMPDGGYWMPLFVSTVESVDIARLSQELKAAIRDSVSPRHVPDEVIEVEALPRTLTGKRIEIPIKRILQGVSPDVAANARSLVNPHALQYFAAIAHERAKDRPSSQT